MALAWLVHWTMSKHGTHMDDVSAHTDVCNGNSVSRCKQVYGKRGLHSHPDFMSCLGLHSGLAPGMLGLTPCAAQAEVGLNLEIFSLR